MQRSLYLQLNLSTLVYFITVFVCYLKKSNPPMKPYNNKKKCIDLFLDDWSEIYPSERCTYVIHANRHLPEDWFYNNTTPDSFSCFPFESFLRKFKKNCSPGSRTLEQVVSFLNILKFKICFTFKRKITREFKICFDFKSLHYSLKFSYFRFTPISWKKSTVETRSRSVTGNNQKHRIDKKQHYFVNQNT